MEDDELAALLVDARLSLAPSERRGCPTRLASLLPWRADAAVVQAADGRLLWVNAEAARFFGFACAEEVIRAGGPAVLKRFAVADAMGRPLSLAELPARRALAEDRSVRRVLRFRRLDEDVERLSISYATVLGGAGGERVALTLFRDITDEKRADDTLRFLSDASRLLASTLDPELTMRSIAHLAVPVLADWCSVHLRDVEGPLTPIAVAHVDRAKVALAEEYLRRYPIDPAAPYGIAEVIRSGRPEHLPRMDDALLRAIALEDGQREALLGLGMRSRLVVPLVTRGRTIGALMLAMSDDRRHFDEDHLALAEDLARRAAVAVDHARLYHAARRSEERLRMALDAARAGAWEWDIRSDRVTISPQLEALHGLAPGSFGGTSEAFHALVHPDDRSRVREAVQSGLEVPDGAAPRPLAYRAIVRSAADRRSDDTAADRRARRGQAARGHDSDGRTRDGDAGVRSGCPGSDGAECRWFELRGRVERDGDGRPIRYVGILSDVTERMDALRDAARS